MWLFIEPLDTLFFRDSKPFAAGESRLVKTGFPPSPYTVAGAIRTKILTDSRVPFDEFKNWEVATPPQNEHYRQICAQVGTTSSYGCMQIRGPLPCFQDNEGRVTAYFHSPLDLFEHGCLAPLEKAPDEDEARYGRAPYRKRGRPKLDDPPPLAPLWSTRELGEEREGFFMNGSALREYLEGAPPAEASCKPEDLFVREIRTGIKLADGRRTAETGMLYMAEFIRLFDRSRERREGKSGLLLELNLSEPVFPTGLLALGGEGRAAYCYRFEQGLDAILDGSCDSLKKKLELNRGRFKIYVASPAIFESGWLPDWVERTRDGYEARIGSVAFKLKAAAVGKPVSIGGWDLASGGARRMWKAVPAGSVYYFEVTDGATEDLSYIDTLFKEFHFTTNFQRRACDAFAHLAQIGFGLTFVGTWDYTKTEV